MRCIFSLGCHISFWLCYVMFMFSILRSFLCLLISDELIYTAYIAALSISMLYRPPFSPTVASASFPL